LSSILDLARPEIRALIPYQHAAWEPYLERLHANEMPWRAQGDNSVAGLNRYPEPQPAALIERLAALYDVDPCKVLAGRGSDEAIDLLVRAFCRAGEDAVIICPPTFGMYSVAARIQGAAVVEVPLDATRGFALDADAVLAACRDTVKIVFLCSPNNPTGNLLERRAIERLCGTLDERALVVLDEAYLEFSGEPGFTDAIDRYPNLVVLRTLSKAYALAGARCGALLAAPDIVELLQRIIPPYALPSPTVEAVLTLLGAPQLAFAAARIETICAERERVARALACCQGVLRVWPSAANFLLVACRNPAAVIAAAAASGLIVRDVRRQPALAQCVRVSIGTPAQNDRLLTAISRAGDAD
jgi:histidinol-phosphate aminotransferase